MGDPTAPPDPVEAELEPGATEPVEVDEPLVEDDLLIEEVSIDGMCGVY
jgi:mycofactocin precursor